MTLNYFSLSSHLQGLSIPVPRGRKGKRVKAQSTFDVQKVEWIRKYNPDTLLLDESYRKHLKHQCNKSVELNWHRSYRFEFVH